jgi:hypothetical protein
MMVVQPALLVAGHRVVAVVLVELVHTMAA